jgi:hypothetical protein
MGVTRIRARTAPCTKADSLRFTPAETIGRAGADPESHFRAPRLCARSPNVDVQAAARQLSESSHDSVATDTAVTTATATATHDSRAAIVATENRAYPSSGPKPDSLRSIHGAAIRGWRCHARLTSTPLHCRGDLSARSCSLTGSRRRLGTLGSLGYRWISHPASCAGLTRITTPRCRKRARSHIADAHMPSARWRGVFGMLTGVPLEPTSSCCGRSTAVDEGRNIEIVLEGGQKQVEWVLSGFARSLLVSAQGPSWESDDVIAQRVVLSRISSGSNISHHSECDREHRPVVKWLEKTAKCAHVLRDSARTIGETWIQRPLA